MRKMRYLGIGTAIVLLGAFAVTPSTVFASVCFACTNDDCADGPAATCQCSSNVLTTCRYSGVTFPNEKCTAKAEE